MAFRYLISSLLIQSLSLGKLIVLIQLGAYFDILTWFLASILSLVNEVVALLCCFERQILGYFCYNVVVVLVPVAAMIKKCNIVTFALGCILLVAQILSKCNQIKTLVNIHWDLD
jgi:hypothetical protein